MRTNLLLSLGVLVLLSGCRMYGGHGSEAATYAQIQEALERYEDRADRLQGDHDAVMAAAAGNAALASAAEATAALVNAQAETLEFHRATVASVSDGSSYRKLNRALGAMVTEQQRIEDQYRRIVAQVQNRPDLNREPESRYTLVPSGLAAVEAGLQGISLRDALAN
ncbi:MAG: hypothetical protein HKN29_00835 [Rhodothermales bacterium]|nr:hypothetical protein [Rhodothermales bacterium]